jgi:hypothetical protein
LSWNRQRHHGEGWFDEGAAARATPGSLKGGPSLFFDYVADARLEIDGLAAQIKLGSEARNGSYESRQVNVV